jgi:hypothetical protein
VRAIHPDAVRDTPAVRRVAQAHGPGLWSQLAGHYTR